MRHDSENGCKGDYKFVNVLRNKKKSHTKRTRFILPPSFSNDCFMASKAFFSSSIFFHLEFTTKIKISLMSAWRFLDMIIH